MGRLTRIKEQWVLLNLVIRTWKDAYLEKIGIIANLVESRPQWK